MPPRAADDAGAPQPSTTAGATFVSQMAARHGRISDPTAATRLLDGVADALARWFGPFGYHALLARALAHARTAHPALTGVRVRAPLTPVLDGVSEATEMYASAAATDGVTAVVSAVVDLVGSVIGDDMALQLLERHIEDPIRAAPETGADRSMPTNRGPTDGMRGVAP